MTYEVAFTEKPRGYCVDGVKVPSVTQILNVLAKDALPWWGMRVGVAGVCDLVQKHEYGLEWLLEPPDVLVAELTKHKLTVNHVRDQAATRGTSVHTAGQVFGETGEVPNLADFPVEDRGYVQAFVRAIMALKPKILANEVIVGSRVHGFAGRFDMDVEIDGRRGLLDLKTGKHVYPTSQFPQLEAYRHAYFEQHDVVTETAWVLRLDADGSFEFVESCAAFTDFLAIKCAYDALAGIKSGVSSRKRAEKAALKAAA